MLDWTVLDRQMIAWGTRLRDDLRLTAWQSSSLASCIASDVASLDSASREFVLRASPIPVSCRLDELTAFQTWMEMAHEASHPVVVRAQVITQNYVCFVYLKEAWFDALRQALPHETVTAACCEFLLSEPLRRFRNAFAHGNWRYLQNFSGLEFWARAKGTGTDEVRSVVSQVELDFWQTLSRCTAYATMLTFSQADI